MSDEFQAALEQFRKDGPAPMMQSFERVKTEEPKRIELTPKQKRAVWNYFKGYSTKAFLEDVDELWENHDASEDDSAVARAIESFLDEIIDNIEGQL